MYYLNESTPLPDLPVLLRPSNLDHWSDILRSLLNMLGLKDLTQRAFPENGPKLDDLGIEDSQDVKHVCDKIEDQIKRFDGKSVFQCEYYSEHSRVRATPWLNTNPGKNAT